MYLRTFGSLKGTESLVFCFSFFHESVSPPAQSIPLGPFRICSKIREDIRKSRCTTDINDTGVTGVTGDNGGKFFHQFRYCY